LAEPKDPLMQTASMLVIIELLINTYLPFWLKLIKRNKLAYMAWVL
jgi:hypothetical protein